MCGMSSVDMPERRAVLEPLRESPTSARPELAVVDGVVCGECGGAGAGVVLGRYGDSYACLPKNVSAHWVGMFTVNAWNTFAVPTCRSLLLTSTDISHDALLRNRWPRDCHTLYGSLAPNADPDVWM